jgi:diguanylate cyclase (GGDEF)-like protein
MLKKNHSKSLQNEEKEKRAAELVIANTELEFQNEEKKKRAAELVIANTELNFQNNEKEKRAAELVIANKELVFQNGEKEKRAAELAIANKELVFQNGEKEKRAAELVIANKELVFQNGEKEKRAAELAIANKELVFQNGEKEKRAAELVIANKELVFQNGEKEKRATELNTLAFYDKLTGLPNRRLFLDRLQNTLISRATHQGAILFIDLDRFKYLNDTLGHSYGDLLLQQVAQRLKSCIRKGDTPARLGGDEFLVLLKNLDQDPLKAAMETKTIGNNIIAILNQSYLLGTHEYFNSVSIGAVIFDHNSKSAEELLKQADIAMYKVKKATSGNILFFDSEMQNALISQASVEADLRKALENHEFELYYQIQMDSSQHPSGAEALIRWIHPKLGVVQPDQFIPTAEESGLITPISQWVLEAACAQLKAWEGNALTSELTMAINISAKQFHQTDFVTKLQSSVQQAAINPARLVLEITESLLLENIEKAIENMAKLKKFGVQFALDDFGTGYSSFQYLRRLPIDELKIDRSFIRFIASDSRDKAIVAAIISMVHSLKLSVNAEGVETEEQRQFLLSKNCTHYQGYLYSMPVPIKQFEALLKQR